MVRFPRLTSLSPWMAPSSLVHPRPSPSCAVVMWRIMSHFPCCSKLELPGLFNHSRRKRNARFILVLRGTTVSCPVLLESRERDYRSVPYEAAHPSLVQIRVPDSFCSRSESAASKAVQHERALFFIPGRRKIWPLSLVSVIPGFNNALRGVHCVMGSNLPHALLNIGPLDDVKNRLSSYEASAVSVPLRDVAFGNRESDRYSPPGFCQWMTRVLHGPWNDTDLRHRPLGPDMYSRVVDENAVEMDRIPLRGGVFAVSSYCRRLWMITCTRQRLSQKRGVGGSHGCMRMAGRFPIVHLGNGVGRTGTGKPRGHGPRYRSLRTTEKVCALWAIFPAIWVVSRRRPDSPRGRLV